MPRVLTVEQTAEKLQMTARVIRKHLRTGKLPGRKIGKSWRVLESDLDTYVGMGESERPKQFVSARGLLKSYPGRLTSADVIAAKRKEAEIEESKLRPKHVRSRQSA